MAGWLEVEFGVSDCSGRELGWLRKSNCTARNEMHCVENRYSVKRGTVAYVAIGFRYQLAHFASRRNIVLCYESQSSKVAVPADAELADRPSVSNRHEIQMWRGLA